MAEEATVPLTVERLTFGPDALAHRDGQVVFVPFAAPGDHLRARVRHRASAYERAEVVDRAAGSRPHDPALPRVRTLRRLPVATCDPRRAA